MTNQPSCGKGLAEHSVLPAHLGELIASLAENLEAHRKALDLKVGNSKKEDDAYSELARTYWDIARQLKAAATKMASYRDLPMGRHDQKVMSGPMPREAFERFVKLEQELLALLQERVTQDRKMLSKMGGAR